MLSIDMTVNTEFYNTLPMVEQADLYVRKHRLVSLMTRTIGPIFVGHGISEFWGIGLLHHHWPIWPGERPAEDQVTDNNNPAFLMRPQQTTSDNQNIYVPCLLGACNLSRKPALFEALEFSSEESAVSAFDQIRTNNRFLLDLHAALVGGGLHKYFGLTSVKPLNTSDLTLVEYTQADRASLLTIKSKSELKTMNFVQTAWTFSKTKTAANCKRSCFKACNVPKAGGHYSTHTALHNPNG